MNKAQRSGRRVLVFGRFGSALHRGSTMIEVMATTAICAVLAGLATPNLADRLATNRVRSEATELSTLLVAARAEAVRRNMPVLVCPSNDDASCSSPLTESSWAGTTIVCYDADRDGQCDDSSAAAPNPVRVRNWSNASVRVSGPASVVRFSGHGTAAQSVTFRLSAPETTSTSSAVIVAAMGSVRLE